MYIGMISFNDRYLDNAPLGVKLDRYMLDQAKYNLDKSLKDDYLKSQKRVYSHILKNPKSDGIMELLIKGPNELNKIEGALKVVLPNSFFTAQEAENIGLLKQLGNLLKESYPNSGAIRNKLIKIGRIKINEITKTPQGVLNKAIRKLKIIL